MDGRPVTFHAPGGTGLLSPRVVASLCGASTAANSGQMAHLVFTLFMAN